MAAMVSRQRALAVVDAEREAWERLVAQVGPERVDEKGPSGDWTLKDLAGHLTGWASRKLDRIEDPDGEDPWPDGLDVDAINDMIYQKNVERPADEVLRDAAAVYLRLRSIIAEMPEAELNDPARVPVLEGRSLGAALDDGSYFMHIREEHGDEIRAWRGMTG